MENNREMDFIEYFSDFFRKKVTELRMAKGISEREMSLAMGHSEGFINHICNGYTLPNFTSFLEICEYLQVTPEEFFMELGTRPVTVTECEVLKELNDRCGGDLSRFLRVLKGIKPRHFQMLLELYEDR